MCDPAKTPQIQRKRIQVYLQGDQIEPEGPGQKDPAFPISQEDLKKYIYTAVFTLAEDGTEVYTRIPDLPGCIATGETIEDTIDQITDVASGWLVVTEDKGMEIPPATPQESISHEPGSVISLTQVGTITYRSMTDTRAVRKNVSLPAWMAELAKRRGINCSQVLQEG